MDQTERIRKLLTDAYHYAKQAFDMCYDNDVRPSNIAMALSFAANCTSQYAAAAAIYLADPKLDDERISAILKQFEVFTAEIRKLQKQTKRNNTGMHIEFEYLEELLCENGYTI